MKKIIGLLLMSSSTWVVAAQNSITTEPVTGHIIREQTSGTPYVSEKDVFSRIQLLDELSQRFLGSEPPMVQDDYAKGWPEHFGVESIRLKRFEKARFLLGNLKEEVAPDILASYAQEKNRQLDQIQLKRLQNDMELEHQKGKALVDAQMATHRTENINRILESLKNDKEVQVDVSKDGSVIIRKGPPPQQLQPAPVILR